MRNSSRLALALLAALSLSSCAAPELSLSFERVLELSRTTLGTDVISRYEPATLRALGRGWSIDVASPPAVGMWATGTEAQLRLFVVQEGPHTLQFDSTPPDGMGGQLLTVGVNGTALEPEVKIGGFRSDYEVDLPADLLHIGFNDITFSFRQAMAPSSYDSRSSDARLLAARFHYIRLSPPLHRPFHGPGQLEATARTIAASEPDPAPVPAPLWRPAWIESPDAAAALQLPADSMLDLAINVPEGTRWVGRSEVVFEQAEPDRESRTRAIEWVAELLTDDGTVHVLGRGSGGMFGGGLSADLSPWAGTDVLLRLRTWGSAGGAVSWHNLGFRTRGEPIDLRQFDPPPLPITESSARMGKPNVVMILLDAARADVFSPYGSDIPTPAVERLAADGTRFDRAYSAAPWTGQSVYSIFTGRYPEAHGIRAWKDVLPTEIRSLFQNMKAAGYYNYLWTEHPMYRSSDALQHDLDVMLDLRRRDRPQRRQLLPKPADMFVDDQPTFAFVHLVPPHSPYDAPAPYGGTLTDWYEGDFSTAAPDLQAYTTSIGEGHPTAEDLRYVWSMYLENVRYADELVGRIVDSIRRSGHYDDTMIVLLSDHGEAFYEHGHFLHTWPLYEEMIRVPLVIKWPASLEGYASVIDQPVSLIDLAPTLLDGIGADAEALGYQGYSLLPAVFDGFAPNRTVYDSTVGIAVTTRDDEPPVPMSTLIDASRKVMFDEVSGRLELYDLDADPAELDDLIRSRPVTAQRMLQRLLLQQQANHLVLGGLEITEAAGEMDPEAAERLRDLGYIR